MRALESGPFGAKPIGDPSHVVAEDIIEGRITPKRDAYSDDPTHPVFLRAQNIEEGFLRFDDAKRLLPEAFAEEPKAILEDGDLVLTIDGVLLGKAAVHRPGDLPCCVSNHMVRIRHGSRVGPDFLAAYLNGPSGQRQIKRGVTGSAIPGLRADAIERIVVPTPPAPKQRELLTALDAARASRRRKLEEAESLLGGLDAFVLETLDLTLPPPDGHRTTYAVRLSDVREGKKLYPDYFHPERLNAIRAIAAEFGPDYSFSLAKLADFRRDQRQVRPDDPYLGLANVQPNTGERIDSTEEDGEGTVFEYTKDDVLFARLRPYLNKVYRAESGGVCSPEFHVMRVRNGNDGKPLVLPDYLAAVLRSVVVLAQTRHMMTGNTHPRLANDDVVNLVVPVPDTATQKKIAAEVTRRRNAARRLREDATRLWDDAKRRFEEELLGPAK
ncbi:MAG: hypothetical protein HJJLKODD_00045 [Phycisphaerae bacterium]|nr:hypothetical protein [Phycisphaerae bacterium]